MKRKSKSPKGPRGGATRGGGRGRGRGSRGSRAAIESQVSQRGAPKTPRGGRGRGRGNHANNALSKVNGDFEGPSSFKGNLSEGEQSTGPKVPSDFYLHKKFKKLTNTITEDIATPSPHAASSSLSPSNGICNGLTIIEHNKHTVVKSSDSTTTETLLINTHKSESLSNFSVNESQNIASTSQSGNNNNMVYKPKFRIASDSESKTVQILNGLSPTNSASCSSSSQGDSDAASSDAGKISKDLRFDRQSLDDRISKIIDENQSLLEWPEHFTKKLKSHTSRNSQSSHSNQLQRTNQLTIMSGGSTTELHSSKSNPSPLQHPHNHINNGLVRHASFDMATSGGTMEFLTNPLIMKAQADMFKSSFSHVVPSTLSISDLPLPLGINSSSMMVPKKRRRLSPTPSRLCGGEVSELPVNEIALSKSYYQDVDMNVRVNNCSGAKVTIRTSNSGGGGSIQSAVNYVRYNEPAHSPLVIDSSSVFFPTTPTANSKVEDMYSFREKDNDIDSLRSRHLSKSPKRKHARPIKTITDSLPPPSPIPEFPEPLALDTRVFKKSPTGSTSSSKSSSTTVSPKRSPQAPGVENISSSKAFQVVTNNNNNPKRPNFLALKPVNNVIKKRDVGVLPSPETPRVAKSYNQMSINGNAYTYLGFKVSTRSSYTCLFKPQPMFIPQSRDPKLSMYSNWQPCPKDPKDPELSMSTNDSRVNGRKDMKTLYTCATGKNCDTLTVSSPKQSPITSPMSEKSALTFFANGSSAPITSLSRSSEPTNSKGISYPTSFPTTSFTTTKSCSISQLSPNKTTITSSVARAISMLSSSSDLSSADESSNFSRREYKIKNESIDAPLALVSKKDDMGKVFMRDDSNSASDKSEMIMSRADGSRVRIMEGGFESNETYTYVRGRGSGRFVCDTCGIRCKKPSMLRKHLKTHTDLRPYTCKLCNFSFKTKGNLTKHQKSKSHHKKCISMGIHPESSQSLASTGPNMDSNSENDSDDDDVDENGDSDSQGDDGDGTSSAGNDSESVEKEIAQSLLDLSRMSSRPLESHDSQSSGWMKQKQKTPEFSVTPMLDKEKVKHSSSNAIVEAPIDLRVKPKSNISSTAICQEPVTKRPKLELNGLVKSIGVVSEAHRWQPEEELITNGRFNLKKVLNTGQINSPKSRPSPPIENPFVREIKQEILDYPCESNGDRACNGYMGRLSRPRKDSDTSVASNSSVNSLNTTANSNLSSENRPKDSPSSSKAKPHKKLHQPWLSPPEKKMLESQKKAEIVVEVKPIESISEKCSTPIVESTNGPSKDLSDDTPSTNGKIFSNVSSGKPQAEFRQPSGAQALVKEDGKAECNVCGKTFSRASQLTLHMNIHYLERPFRCDPCGVSFRTKGHLIKHRRSSSHDCKVYLTEAWGVANEENPRPFKCPDCKIAFRIHGHLAKHLRSKIHIMRMECLGKLPFGIYFEMEKSGMNLNEIDTTDCDMSLVSLQSVAKKIYGDTWSERLTIPVEEPA